MRLSVLAALLISLPAYADDVVLTHQVRVLDASGAPIEGPHSLTVRLYADASSPAPVWTETFSVVVQQGYASLQLGLDPGNPMSGRVAASASYVQADVDGIPMGARQRLSAVPIAARSLIADSVDGDVVVQDLKLDAAPDASCSGVADHGRIRWSGDTFQGCRPGGWSNMLMAAPGDAATTGMASASGMIAYFEGECPDGWSEKIDLRGRVVVAASGIGAVGNTVGSALSDRGLRTITEAPSHSHSVTSATGTSSSAGNHNHAINPPPVRSGNQTADHSHRVDPPSTNTNTTGNHGHSISTRQDDWNASGGPASGRPSWGTDNGTYAAYHSTNAAGNHNHNVDIAAFNSQGVSASHQHDIDISPFPSGNDGTHNHTTTISGQTAAATGPATVDVTMPYIHLTGCELE